MSRVVHFEIHADNPERAVAFYKDVFEWKVDKWGGEEPYWLVTTGDEGAPGINGGIMKRRGAVPAEGAAVNAYVCTIDVASVDEFVEKATKAGGTVALPKMPIPGVGWLAYCKDTEGNIFGMTEKDTAAS